MHAKRISKWLSESELKIHLNDQSILQWLLEDGSIEYLEPPEYHGNPIDAEGSLVTWKYGYDIVDIIKEATGLETSIVLLDDMTLGIKGEYLEVLVTRKPSRERPASPDISDSHH